MSVAGRVYTPQSFRTLLARYPNREEIHILWYEGEEGHGEEEDYLLTFEAGQYNPPGTKKVLDLSGMQFHRCHWKVGALLPGIDAHQTKWVNTTLRGVNLSGADLREAVFSNTDISSTWLEKADLTLAKGFGTASEDMKLAILRYAQAQHTVWYHWRFDGADLSHACFDNARFEHCSFQNTILEGTLFRDRAIFLDCNFTGSVMLRTNFTGSTDLNGQSIFAPAKREGVISWPTVYSQ